MIPTVAKVAEQLEARGALIRGRVDQSAKVIERVQQELGQTLPKDLEDFYRERIARVGDFLALMPIWNDRVGWRPQMVATTALFHARAAPIFSDGCGSLYGVDLDAGDNPPAVYFFDHVDEFRAPRWAAGSTLAAFLLLLADGDRAHRDDWPPKWELAVDPDLEYCPRAPAIWNVR